MLTAVMHQEIPIIRSDATKVVLQNQNNTPGKASVGTYNCFMKVPLKIVNV